MLSISCQQWDLISPMVIGFLFIIVVYYNKNHDLNVERKEKKWTPCNTHVTTTLHYTAVQYTAVQYITLQCTRVHCSMQTVHCLLCRHSFNLELFGQSHIPQSQHCWGVLCTVHCTIFTVYCALYKLYCILCTVHCIMFSV